MSANLELRAKLRLRANTLVNKYMESAMPPSRADFVELIHNALIEASMLGCELAVHELYSLSGLDRNHATTSAADVMHTLQPRSNQPEDRDIKDAARYRWLRSHLPAGTIGEIEVWDEDSMDAAIDSQLPQLSRSQEDK